MKSNKVGEFRLFGDCTDLWQDQMSVTLQRMQRAGRPCLDNNRCGKRSFGKYRFCTGWTKRAGTHGELVLEDAVRQLHIVVVSPPNPYRNFT